MAKKFINIVRDHLGNPVAKTDKLIDEDETYYIFNPPMNPEERDNLRIEAQKEMSPQEITKLRYMVELGNRGLKSRFFSALDDFMNRGVNAAILWNIAPMKGRELISFCEEYAFVALFDIQQKDVRRFVYTHGVGQHEAGLMRQLNNDMKPRDNCCMLVPLQVYLDMMENSILNNPGGGA